MTTLLTFRNNMKAFFGNYDFVVTPIAKGVFSFVLLWMLNREMGFFPALNNALLLLGVSVVCAFLPVEMLAGICSVFFVLQSVKVSIDVGLLALALVLFFYCAYMRFAPKTGIIFFLVPMLYSLKLVYAIPILLGFIVGPAAIIPTFFGVVLYYFQIGLTELSNLLANAVEGEETVQGYQYIINLLVDNKYMLLTFVVFACVILITYIIYRMSFHNSWLVAFIVGGILNIVLFLVGSIFMVVEVDIVSILLGTFVGVLLAVILQFCKGIVDYQRTELLQFEDDDYYYYVKAIPKLSVSESNKNVKHINSKTSN